MAKRSAQTDLNHDNWDEENEDDDVGVFSKANEEQMKHRIIKKARRRTALGNASTPSAAAPYFKGFTLPTTGAKGDASNAVQPSFSFLNSLVQKADDAKLVNGAAETNHQHEYEVSIRGLNVALAAWISEQVKENSYCKLTPIFADYQKHLTAIESKKTTETESKTTIKMPASSPFAANSTSVASTPFSFGSGLDIASTVPKPSTATTNSAFTFGSTVKPTFSFSSTASDASNVAASNDTNEDNEDEPPKNEFKMVEEKDSLYSKRCKLFVKSQNNYSDRGIGTLHIKQIDEKVQLLLRADTSLGNVLLNIILNDTVPLQRMGKNNVLIMCVPTPDAKPPPTCVLLRVKTAEEADELHDTLLKYKAMK